MAPRITFIFLCAKLSHTVTIICIQITSKEYKDLGRCFLPTKGTVVRNTVFFTPPPQTLVPSKKKKKKIMRKLNFQSLFQLVNKEFTLSELNCSIFLEHMVRNKNKNICDVKAQRVLIKHQYEQRNKK